MNEPRLFDTNVLIHANSDQTKSPQTTLECMLRCAKILLATQEGEYGVVLDRGRDGSKILEEYLKNLDPSSQALGDQFLQWLLNHQGYPDKVRRVVITPDPYVVDSYAEFPNRADLMAFDPRDRKWVAAAIAHDNQYGAAAPIIQSADEKWRAFVPALNAVGVSIDFICDNTP